MRKKLSCSKSLLDIIIDILWKEWYMLVQIATDVVKGVAIQLAVKGVKEILNDKK